MKINHSEYTISEIIDMIERNEVIVNKEYQRSAGIWPPYAQSYFIDTILEGFSFPKIYFYQNLDKKTRKPIKEIVDGQQRLHAIKEFVGNNIRIGGASKNHSGKKFDDLAEEKQNDFLMYSVPTDVILSASRSELLEMFRRINAYTAPLNEAEKRNSVYQGDFKWFITELCDKFSPTLEEFKILTDKQIIRMADAELFTDLALVLDVGIKSKSSTQLGGIYKKYNDGFANKDAWMKIFESFFDLVHSELSALKPTFIFKPYVFYSVFAAFVHAKFGITNGERDIGHASIGTYFNNRDKMVEYLSRLAEAHELQTETGEFSEYVKACLNTTTKEAQRKTRTYFIYKALI